MLAIVQNGRVGAEGYSRSGIGGGDDAGVYNELKGSGRGVSR